MVNIHNLIRYPTVQNYISSYKKNNTRYKTRGRKVEHTTQISMYLSVYKAGVCMFPL